MNKSTAPTQQNVSVVTVVFSLLATLVVLPFQPAAGAETVWLSQLDQLKLAQGWGQPAADKSIQGGPLSIAGQTFEKGIGTRAPSTFSIDLDGMADRFTAYVGVDDAARKTPGHVGATAFRVVGDGKTLFKANVMKVGEAAWRVDIDVSGVKQLILYAKPMTEYLQYNFADWADAKIEYRGSRPAAAKRGIEMPVILTPRPARKPRINGPRVYGARKGSPFLFTIAATGDRPMEFSALDLPTGLQCDPTTGRVTGAVHDRGEYVATLGAKNSLGTAQRKFRIVVGDSLALTPHMGWNSWYCWEARVTDQIVRDAADAMVRTGMIDHGYMYVNIDDTWMVKPDSNDPKLGGEPRDSGGMINANGKFPDMKGLADYIHNKGLKAGLYTSPGPTTCGGYVGSYQHEALDAQRFAEWGFDFLKYDWCSYEKVAKDHSLPELKKPYLLMAEILGKQKRDIVFNLCQYGLGNVWEWGAAVGGNSWRTARDIGLPGDMAYSIFRIGFNQDGLEKHAGPGHWNDPDYLLLGWLTSWKGGMAPTELTPNEQYSYVSLWSLLAAPLILGGDITRLDDFTLNLVCNDEVIGVDQDPLGRQGHRVARADDIEVWAKDLEDGSKAVGLFNTGDFPLDIAVRWSDLGISGKRTVRDLWRQKDIGDFDGQFKAPVEPHGVVLVRIPIVQ